MICIAYSKTALQTRIPKGLKMVKSGQPTPCFGVVFFRLKTEYPEVCLVHLYTLQGAIEDSDYNMLSEETKKELKAFSDGLK